MNQFCCSQKRFSAIVSILDSIICSLDPPWTAETAVSHTDVQFFFQDVYDKFQGAVQYNNDNTVSKDKILSLVKNKN